MKNKTIHLLLTASLVAASMGGQMASAAVGGPIGPDCTEMLNPFNPSGVYAAGDTSIYLKYFSESACKTHAPYPGPHNPISDSDAQNVYTVQQAAIDDNIHGPWTRHRHFYYNNSVQDNFYYKSYIAAFEITVQSDAVNNTDLGELQCPVFGGQSGTTYDNFLNCVDGATDNDPNHFGGIKLTRTNSGGKVILRWDFGTVDGSKKPWESGKNPGVDLGDSPQIFPFNTSTDINRSFPANTNGVMDSEEGMNVYLKANDKSPAKIWTGTTTSRVLIRDAVLYTGNKNNYNLSPSCPDKPNLSNPSNGWCAVDYASNPEVYNNSSPGPYGDPVNTTAKYYWVPIGTVTTVWKPTTPPPPDAVCEDITLTPATVNAPGTTNYTATVTFDDGNSYNTTITWSQVGSGTFSGGTTQTHSSSTNFTNSYNTAANTGEVTAKVTAITGAANSVKCAAGVKVKNPPGGNPYCTGITLSPSGLTAPGSTPLSATVTYSDGNSYNTGVTWSQVGSGTFSSGTTQTHSSSTNFTNTYNTSSDTASVNVKVTSVPVGVDNSPICQNGTTITDTPPDNECKALNATPGSSIDVPAGGSVLIKADPENTDGTKPSNIHWSENGDGWFTTGPTSDFANAFFPGTCPIPSDPHSANTSFSAPYVCDYYYNASPDGTGSGSFEAEPNNGNKAICKGEITESDAPDNDEPYCAGLVLDPNKLDEDGTTNLHATVLIGNDDGLPHETTVQWSGDGNFDNFSPAETSSNQQESFGKNFFTRFEANDADNSEAGVKVLSITGIPDSSLGICKDLHKFKKPNENEKCEYFDTTEKQLPNGNFEICVDSNNEYIDKNGRFTIEYGNQTKTKYVPGCVEVPANTEYDLYATDEPNNAACRDDDRNTGKRPPTLEKYVRRIGKDYRKVVSVATTETSVEYKLVFTPSEPNTIAFITDTIGQGIPGITYGEDGAQPGGEITYDDSLNISEEGYGDLPECTSLADDADKEHCYNGPDLNGIELVKVSNPVTITYKGKVAPVLTEASCKEGKICQEKFVNVARAQYKVVDENDEVLLESDNPLFSSSTVQLFCQYILTRAAGDVYLEKDLDAGVDIRKCSKYKSTTGVILTPAPPPPPNSPSTGIPTEIISISHEICTEGQTGSLDPALKPFYGQGVSENLSSQICEVKLQPGEQWKKTTIVNSIEENKTRISRWKPTSTISTSLAALAGANPDLEVLRVKGSLTVDQDYTLSDGEGAKTIIVEDGDLIIKNNIKYGTCNKNGGVCNVTDTASLAFIVLGGNVYVDPSVTEMSGVFFVQGQGDKGHLYPGSPGNTGDSAKTYDNKLEIFGSVYGDIEPLFLSRLYAGDPAQEEAGIVIRFDERVILNTPPGLRDILTVTQSDVAR